MAIKHDVNHQKRNAFMKNRHLLEMLAKQPLNKHKTQTKMNGNANYYSCYIFTLVVVTIIHCYFNVIQPFSEKE